MNQTDDKDKTTQKVIIFGVFLIAVFVCIQMLLKKPLIDENMAKAASEVNKICPFMVDSITRLDNSAALPNNVFLVNYTLLNADKSIFDTTELINTIKPITLNGLKTNPKYKLFRDIHTNISFVYHDKNGSYLCTLQINSDEYK